MKRVAAYIDGFNLYHAVDDLHDDTLKWIDLWALCQSFVRKDEVLEAVNYFSAYATWMPDSHARHRVYVAANQACGVKTIMGNFKMKPRSCKKCGAKWMGHEEKETDVNIAITLVADALRNSFDRAMIISGDTDLAPALRMVKSLCPQKETFVIAPPKRFGSARELNQRIEITPGRLRKHLLPETVRDKSGNVAAVIPDKYRP